MGCDRIDADTGTIVCTKYECGLPHQRESQSRTLGVLSQFPHFLELGRHCKFYCMRLMFCNSPAIVRLAHVYTTQDDATDAIENGRWDVWGECGVGPHHRSGGCHGGSHAVIMQEWVSGQCRQEF
jgi:hypothetical protein